MTHSRARWENVDGQIAGPKLTADPTNRSQTEPIRGEDGQSLLLGQFVVNGRKHDLSTDIRNVPIPTTLEVSPFRSASFLCERKQRAISVAVPGGWLVEIGSRRLKLHGLSVLRQDFQGLQMVSHFSPHLSTQNLCISQVPHKGSRCPGSDRAERALFSPARSVAVYVRAGNPQNSQNHAPHDPNRSRGLKT